MIHHIFLSLVILLVTVATQGHAANGPPIIASETLKPRQMHRAGTTIRLACPAEGSPPPLIGWEKDGESINVGWDRFRVGDSGLRIKELSEDDSGKYLCKATNGFGTATVEYWLYVYPDTNDTVTPPFPIDEDGNFMKENLFPPIDGFGDPPRFISPREMQNSELVKPRGSTIRLKCRASGRPKPEIRWFHNGALLPQEVTGATGDDLRHDKWILKLSDVTDDHDGRYMCKVQNRAGAINFTYTVEVVERLSKPVIMDPHPVNTTINFGETTSLQCSVKSDVQPTIQWLKRVDNPYDLRHKNTTIEVDNEQFIVLKTGLDIRREDGTYLNKLTVYGAMEHDSGMYICLGANSMGYNLRSAFLTVLPNPHQEDEPTMQTSALALIIGLPAAVVILIFIVAVFLIKRHCQANNPKTKTVIRHRPQPPPPVNSPYGVVPVPQPQEKMYDHQYMALRPQPGSVLPPGSANTYGHFHSVPSSDNSGSKNYGPVDAHSDSSSTPKQGPPPMQQGHLTQLSMVNNQHPHLHQAPPPPQQQHMHYHYGC